MHNYNTHNESQLIKALHQRIFDTRQDAMNQVPEICNFNQSRLKQYYKQKSNVTFDHFAHKLDTVIARTTAVNPGV